MVARKFGGLATDRLQGLIVDEAPEIERIDPPTGPDAHALAALLAEAFHDDPMQRWLFPHSLRRSRRLERFYRLDIRHRLADRADVFRAGEHGVAFWQPPAESSSVPVRSAIRIAPAFASVAAHHPVRAGRVLGEVVRRRPREPHWYLSHLAVRERHRGTGLGRRLLDVGLDLATRDGVGVYLETSNPDNMAFYARAGLREVGVVRVTGAPPVWLLRREAGG